MNTLNTCFPQSYTKVSISYSVLALTNLSLLSIPPINIQAGDVNYVGLYILFLYIVLSRHTTGLVSLDQHTQLYIHFRVYLSAVLLDV